MRSLCATEPLAVGAVAGDGGLAVWPYASGAAASINAKDEVSNAVLATVLLLGSFALTWSLNRKRAILVPVSRPRLCFNSKLICHLTLLWCNDIKKTPAAAGTLHRAKFVRREELFAPTGIGPQPCGY